MPKFNYVAMDAKGKETRGNLDAKNQSEALARLQEMNLFPTKVTEAVQSSSKGKNSKGAPKRVGGARGKGKKKGVEIKIPLHKIPGLGGVSSKVLCTFTRQLATLIDAGLPLLLYFHAAFDVVGQRAHRGRRLAGFSRPLPHHGMQPRQRISV